VVSLMMKHDLFRGRFLPQEVDSPPQPTLHTYQVDYSSDKVQTTATTRRPERTSRAGVGSEEYRAVGQSKLRLSDPPSGSSRRHGTASGQKAVRYSGKGLGERRETTIPRRSEGASPTGRKPEGKQVSRKFPVTVCDLCKVGLFVLSFECVCIFWTFYHEMMGHRMRLAPRAQIVMITFCPWKRLTSFYSGRCEPGTSGPRLRFVLSRPAA